MKDIKSVIVLSGGQDSTTCLFLARHCGYDLHAVTFDYGQRHKMEINAAIKVAGIAEVSSHEIIELGPILKGTSPLISEEDLEQYKGYDDLPGGLEKTFVPMRNQLFLTVAANRAYVIGCNRLITGVAQEDFGGYPDCRQEFITSFAETCRLGAFTGIDGAPPAIHIWTPLMNQSKAQTVRMALETPMAYEALAFTHTSYDGEYPPTGRDHATLLREKGFAHAGVPDPLILRAYLEHRMPLPTADNYNLDDEAIWYRLQQVEAFLELHG
jgi:7-cyano-7-deazaguanine synthase